MEHVQISEVPDLENALLIGAFAGWNDAASAATWAVKFLINQWEASQFAEIDPEIFYDFTETRPRVRITGGSVRRLTWPANRFYVRKAERTEEGPQQRDLVLLLGEEPQLRWKTYAQEVLEVCQRCNVKDVALLGALVAEVPHTLPVRISGTASEQKVLRRMERAQIERANYEGTSGILTVVQDLVRRNGMSTVSLWGTAPHYVSATPNLPVSEALLEKLSAHYSLDLRLQDLEKAARRFTARVTSLVAADPEVSAYVRELEQRTIEEGSEGTLGTPLAGDASGVHRIPMDGELPTAEQAIQDIEAWLRQQNHGDAGEA
ncbi:MAG: PAC2 family protein [Ktedonobacterales bacterium]